MTQLLTKSSQAPYCRRRAPLIGRFGIANENSVNAYRLGDPQAALEKFPHGEDKGFITSIEKSWLEMWQRQWDPKPLQNQVTTFDDRKFISLSREAGDFLLQESEEGYVPSEHEVTLLHLLSAVHFLGVDQKENAVVELRQAGYVLDHYWDDPSLRIWLGSLWAAADHWDAAQVDFRRANQLEPNAEVARLAEGPQVANLYLNFYGEAPTLRWREGEYTPSVLPEKSEPSGFPKAYSTQRRFERHQLRNSQLRDVLVKSNFEAQYLGSKVLTGAERGIGKAAIWSIRAGAVIVGIAVTAGAIYLVSRAAGGGGEALAYLAGGGLIAGAGIWRYAGELDRTIQKKFSADEAGKRDDLKIYRVVRFLPGWISVSTHATSAVKNLPVGEDGRTRLTLANSF